jgi:hypothetical protein
VRPAESVKKSVRLKIILATSLLLILGIIVAVYALAPKYGTVEYHLHQLGSLKQQYPPYRFKDYFRLGTWRWFAHGKPDLLKGWNEHEEALIKLGYFERHDFVLKHPILDGKRFWTDFHSMVDARISECRFMMHLVDESPAACVIGIATTPSDLPIFQAIITELDKETTNAVQSSYDPP